MPSSCQPFFQFPGQGFPQNVSGVLAAMATELYAWEKAIGPSWAMPILDAVCTFPAFGSEKMESQKYHLLQERLQSLLELPEQGAAE